MNSEREREREFECVCVCASVISLSVYLKLSCDVDSLIFFHYQLRRGFPTLFTLIKLFSLLFLLVVVRCMLGLCVAAIF